jgi:hypothetical protein
MLTPVISIKKQDLPKVKLKIFIIFGSDEFPEK